MKNYTPVALVFTVLLFLAISNTSCNKTHVGDGLTQTQIIPGHWNINRIQLKIFYNGAFAKDTILKQTPKPENFVELNASGGFEYRFNTNTSNTGTYEIVHGDSVIAYTTNKVFRWKILTVIPELFTVMSTGTDPAFPGATVETYHTLVK